MSERMTDDRWYRYEHKWSWDGGEREEIRKELRRARASEDAKDKEIAALKADNADLAERMRLIRDAGINLEEVVGIARTALSQPRPGSAILEELTRLRAQVATLIAGQQSNGEARQRAILDFACELADTPPEQRHEVISRIIDRSEDKP